MLHNFTALVFKRCLVAPFKFILRLMLTLKHFSFRSLVSTEKIILLFSLSCVEKNWWVGTIQEICIFKWDLLQSTPLVYCFL